MSTPFIQKLHPGTTVWVVTLLLRFLAAFRLSSSDLVLPDSGDMQFYYIWAQKILTGAPQEGAFYGLPGYPYLLALFFSVTGVFPFAVILFQCVVDAFTGLLLYRFGCRIQAGPLGSWIGALAGLAWAFYQPAQAYALTLMPATWGTCLLWALAGAMIRTEAHAAGRWLLLGVGAGLASLLLSNLLVLTIFGLGLLFLSQPDAQDAAAARVSRWVPRMFSAALLVTGVALGTAPVWGFHRFVAREPVFLSAHAGLNFYIGNGPGAHGYPRTPPGLRASQRGMLQDSIAIAEAESGRTLTRAEVSEFWSRQARAHILADPVGWGRLLLRKMFRFWNGFQYDDVGAIALLQDRHILLPGFDWRAVAMIGLPGLALAAARLSSARAPAAVVLLHLGSLLPVFVTERYRLPAAPGLCLFAVWLVVTVTVRLRAGQWRFPALAIGTVAACAPLVLLPCRDPALLALAPYNTGVHALSRGELHRAATLLERAEKLAPESAEIQFALGNVALERGDSVEARRRYRTVVELNPRHDGAWNNLGLIALQEGRWQVAERLFQRSLEAEPDDTRTLWLMAAALEGQGRREEGAQIRQRAIQLDPRVLRLPSIPKIVVAPLP